MTSVLNYEHRKATRRLKITDEAGKPLSNTVIQFNQTKHEFLFGSGAFDALMYANSKGDMKMLSDRMEKWLALYNYGTLPFYWGNFERVEGKTDTNFLMNAAKYLRENNVTIKGHPLCWHTVCADWLLAYDDKTILEKQLNRINREVTDFKGMIDIWDVINEVVIMPVFDKYDNGVTRICKSVGRVELVKETFAAAKAANPNASLLLNDFVTTDEYARLIDECLNAGIPIDTIGVQSHQHQGYWGTEKIYEVLERFGKFNLPIHFTENTIISGSLIPPEIEDLNDFQVKEWPSTEEGEELQKEQMEEMYRILFANPKVKAITGWDFGDGNWLGAPSGIMRIDNTPKPAYYRMLELIKGEWWTKEEIHTDENGFVDVCGFKGEYEVNYNGKIASVVLTDGTEEIELMLK